MSLKYVIMHYGPVESFNLGVEHKPQFIYGVRDRLLRQGYRVDVKPVQAINCFLLEMCGYEVFKCNIKNLAFNMPFKKDPVGQLALKAVEKAEAKFSLARDYLWLRDFTSKFFKHLDHSKVISIGLTAIGSIASMNTCADCCGILRKKDSGTQDINRRLYEKSSVDILFADLSKAFSRNLENNEIVKDKSLSKAFSCNFESDEIVRDKNKSMGKEISFAGRLNDY